ncbi:MAG: DUF2946 domain-containing protein [Rhodoferax sp.]|nr:DUF2946 domain-containing protein [Rhodoferax sp.]
MAVFHSLRQAHTLIRGMVACFALAVGMSVAAPWVHAPSLALVCTTAGEPIWVADPASDPAGDAQWERAHTLDCVLCLPAVAPPAVLHTPLALGRYHERATPAATQHAFQRFARAALARGPPAAA